ncbi:MAG: hypothetical protein Q4C67_08310 [Deinococcus sp.]|nr:hypothetical protein [Deinococcus sp.]
MHFSTKLYKPEIAIFTKNLGAKIQRSMALSAESAGLFILFPKHKKGPEQHRSGPGL